MRIERLTLINFRSYKKQVFHFKEQTVIVAPNGYGKTNVLEAIYLLASGGSERAQTTEEMMSFESEIASVTAIVEDKSERSELAVVLTRGAYMGKRTQKRRYLVDGVARHKVGFVGKLVCVLFRPEDMRLVEGSPSRRRGYMDEVLSMAHPEYSSALSIYEASLKRRNRLLDAIREGLARREQLTYWDQSIIKNGNILSKYRRELLEYLSSIETSYGKYELAYDDSSISPSRLAQYSEAEIAVGYTLVGPHKDDFRIIANPVVGDKRDLMKYGSRGQQRLAVLFLKMTAIQYIEQKLGIKSVLLLDDIFSELDIEHRKAVVSAMAGRQVIVTSAEEEVIFILPQADIVRLERL